MYLTKCPHSLEVRPITVYGFFLAVLFKSMYIVTELWNYLVQGRLSRVESNTTDRDAGKSQGGGVCLYVNQQWCTNIRVKGTMGTADIELLSASVHPFYLPREFPPKLSLFICALLQAKFPPVGQ